MRYFLTKSAMSHLIGLGFPLGAPPGRDPSPEEGMSVMLSRGADQLRGVFFCERLGRGVGQRFIACFPKRTRLDVFVPVLPCFLAQIFTAETIRLAKEQRVKIFPGFEWPLGRSAGVSAMLDCPIVW